MPAPENGAGHDGRPDRASRAGSLADAIVDANEAAVAACAATGFLFPEAAAAGMLDAVAAERCAALYRRLAPGAAWRSIR